jgi:hypothetical protein
MKITPRQRSLIRDFVADVGGCNVRDPKLARELKCSELRTNKHSYLAVSWDELGNAFVMTQGGARKQLIGDETKAVRV